MKFQNIADLKNHETGKTYREENNAKKHKFRVGDLVEILEWEEDSQEYDFGKMRMYIIGCVRDCDGTPLYVLGSKKMELYNDDNKRTYNYKSQSGFSEEYLTLIESNS